jgi:aminoglycoside 6'-N-acetyltransferase I
MLRRSMAGEVWPPTSAAVEEWARSHGCVEMASDTWIENELSQSCHEALGFAVVDRCVHYRKGL